jgi:integrative and conjugative element protein (TIGR02256 family)
MQRQRLLETAWINQSALREIVSECERSLPNETGGCLIGYWADKEIVIAEMIGPGPNAVHGERHFEPDHEWQVSEIATRYERSNFTHTYLGDWHSHPQRPSVLSLRDMRTLRRIASYGPARAPIPIMGIIGGGDPWSVRIWYLETLQFKWFRFPTKREVLKIRFYE